MLIASGAINWKTNSGELTELTSYLLCTCCEREVISEPYSDSEVVVYIPLYQLSRILHVHCVRLTVY